MAPNRVTLSVRGVVLAAVMTAAATPAVAHDGWHHGWHDSHYGWWWASAGLWALRPVPIYLYDPYVSSPSVVVVQPSAPSAPVVAAQPTQQYWYYCDAAQAYYPYVSTCPAGWRPVPANPPQQ